jgi:hypothetical protein
LLQNRDPETTRTDPTTKPLLLLKIRPGCFSLASACSLLSRCSPVSRYSIMIIQSLEHTYQVSSRGNIVFVTVIFAKPTKMFYQAVIGGGTRVPVTPVTKSYEKCDGELQKIHISESVRETGRLGCRIGSRTWRLCAIVLLFLGLLVASSSALMLIIPLRWHSIHICVNKLSRILDHSLWLRLCRLNLPKIVTTRWNQHQVQTARRTDAYVISQFQSTVICNMYRWGSHR